MLYFRALVVFMCSEKHQFIMQMCIYQIIKDGLALIVGELSQPLKGTLNPLSKQKINHIQSHQVSLGRAVRQMQ